MGEGLTIRIVRLVLIYLCTFSKLLCLESSKTDVFNKENVMLSGFVGPGYHLSDIFLFLYMCCFVVLLCLWALFRETLLHPDASSLLIRRSIILFHALFLINIFSCVRTLSSFLKASMLFLWIVYFAWELLFFKYFLFFLLCLLFLQTEGTWNKPQLHQRFLQRSYLVYYMWAKP